MGVWQDIWRSEGVEDDSAQLRLAGIQLRVTRGIKLGVWGWARRVELENSTDGVGEKTRAFRGTAYTKEKTYPRRFVGLLWFYCVG